MFMHSVRGVSAMTKCHGNLNLVDKWKTYLYVLASVIYTTEHMFQSCTFRLISYAVLCNLF